MSADRTRRVATLLAQAVQADMARVRYLDEIARGEIKLDPNQREELKAWEKTVRELLDRLAGAESSIRQRMRVVDIDPEYNEKEQVPRRLRDAYALLCHAAYGSDPAISTGDPVIKPGVGKRRVRTSTNQQEPHGGASKSGKRPGASRRSVIRDRKAYEMKERVDRKLRRAASEIEAFNAGSEADLRIFQCSRCGRHAEEGWKFCPYCGFEVVEVKE